MSKAKMRLVAGILMLSLMVGIASVCAAAVPSLIPYLGRLTDGAGTPLNGAYSIRFSLWNALTGGAEVWNETQPAVTAANGLFSVSLGSVTAIPASAITGGDLFLEIKVGADPAMAPRQRVGTTVYALRAGLGPALASTSTTVDVGFAPNVIANITSISVNFPAAGYALVTGFCDAGASGQFCFGTSITTTSGVRDFPNENYFCNPAPAYVETNFLSQKTYPVTAGTTTFYFVGEAQSGTWNVFWNRLTVEYFPDAIGTPTEPPAPQDAKPGNGPGHSQDK